ncbi:cysteine proteinase inhibitor 1 [Phalaenopsis equestris]|uniref:cysteine proteinase inhibitor 1 n=1 Tax=Phalaenopsis equestris TaxID=78828 RepID=UPI0009E34046|nr:cysteine proteinase inhibitor 1 [Phalaenopsis equestris]
MIKPTSPPIKNLTPLPKSPPQKAKMRSLLFLSAFLLAAALFSTTGARGSPMVGAWEPIDNLSDPHVQEIARFAVAENNEKTNGVLKLSRVVSGESQVVAGTKYRLIVEAGGGGGPAKYEAVVWDQPWKKFRQLISFHKVNY